MKSCESCQCPAPSARENCAFCGAPLLRPQPVAFSLSRHPSGFHWVTDGALVASAANVNGAWQLADARGALVATLVPIGEAGSPGHMAVVSPKARFLGSIRDTDDTVPGGGAVAADADGRAVLVLRRDGGQGAHLVDRSGEVVAIASWDDPDACTDMLVTPVGTRYSLAMVFGLLISLELSRHTHPAK